MRSIFRVTVVLAALLAVSSRADAQTAPTPEEYGQLKRAVWFSTLATALIQACSLDKSGADADMRNALGRFQLDVEQRKELVRVTIAAIMGAAGTLEGPRGADWCDQRRKDVDELLLPMHLLGLGQNYTGPLQAPPNL
jgi:hypothetical protein